MIGHLVEQQLRLSLAAHGLCKLPVLSLAETLWDPAEQAVK